MNRSTFKTITAPSNQVDALGTIKTSSFSGYTFLQQQQNNNYNNEYERVLSELSRTNLPATVNSEFDKKKAAL